MSQIIPFSFDFSRCFVLPPPQLAGLAVDNPAGSYFRAADWGKGRLSPESRRGFPQYGDPAWNNQRPGAAFAYVMPFGELGLHCLTRTSRARNHKKTRRTNAGSSL